MSKASVSATAGLLIVASLFVYANTRGPDDDGKLKFGQKPLDNFNIMNVDSIVFEKGAEESFELKRNVFHSWKVHSTPTEFPVDEAKLRSFFVQLMSLRAGDRIPGGESHRQALGLPSTDDAAPQQPTSQAGGRILLRDGQRNVTLFEMASGKARTFGAGMYARFSGKPEVYLIAENLDPVYDANYWRDKAIVDADSDDVAAIEFLALKGAPRFERISPADPWQETRADGARSILMPRFAEKTLPRLADSLKDLNFVHLMPRTSNDRLEKYTVSTIGLELYSGKYYTVTLYRRPGIAPDLSTQYFATLQVRLVPGHSFEKLESFGLASYIADFNYKGASWFYVLDESPAKRFLVNQ